MSIKIKIGNFLYKYAFPLYDPLYTIFKNRQDKYEISLLHKYLHPGDIVVDIGANIGFYAKILSQIVGESGRVHCFEPDTKNFEYLRSATRDLKNVIVNNQAVGAKDGKLKIYLSKELNVDHRTYEPESYDESFEIDSITIDNYFKENTHVDFIKIDIQGFEMQAIQGMQKILDQNKSLKLISEFWPYGLRKAGSSITEYFKFLKKNGFECYLMENDSMVNLTMEKVAELEPLGEERYFNIFVTREKI